MSKIIALVGPTGSGKTFISIELAKMLDAEIINADSVQVYKDFNIGSAKVRKKEMKGIRHHLLDFKEVNEDYTVYDYQKDARKKLNALIKKNKNVIITGGTGLYLKALLYDYKFSDEPPLLKDYSSLTSEEIKRKIDSIFPDNNIHINNRQRLERFLSAYEASGKIIKNETKDDKVYNFLCVGLTMDREVLYRRLDYRVDVMINEGLIEEARSLYNKKAVIFNNIIGYKEFTPYFKNETTLEETINLIKKHTRNYAKRQYTWFNNQMDVKWFNINLNNPKETAYVIYEYIKKH